MTESGRDGDRSTFEVQARAGADPREDLARRLVQNGWGLRQLVLRRSSLEERFVQAVREAALPRDDEPEAA